MKPLVICFLLLVGSIASTEVTIAEELTPTQQLSTIRKLANERAAAFVADYEANIKPLMTQSNLSWWKANTTGADSAYKEKEEAERKLNEALSNPQAFAQLKALRQIGVSDKRLARQIDMLYHAYLGNQVAPSLLNRMTSKANEIEKAFNVFRAKVDGQALSDSLVRKELKDSTDSKRRQAVWEASKKVGEVIEANILELVRLRNESASKLGFKDYHAMQLSLNEQEQSQVIALFDELDELTREPYRLAKREIDSALASKYDIPIGELRPWHYQDPFFQEAPAIYKLNLDTIFENTDIPAVCQKFYRGIGLPIDDVIKRSDLFEKKGKSPHAFCTDIDRNGDVRVLANVVPNEYWMTTMLHELGHAVYSSKNIPDSLPYILRSDAHILATEGMAMMFERLASSSQWLNAMSVDVDSPADYDEVAAKKRRNRLLIFSRWCQVMLRFEKSMYENPTQDLNRRWWDLVEDYQMITPPKGRNAPDYASKIHIVSAPAYYHNYMMGELFACQLHQTIAKELLPSEDPTTAVYFENPQVGEFLKAKVFSQGASRSWNDLTEFATGEPLNAKAFAAEFSN